MTTPRIIGVLVTAGMAAAIIYGFTTGDFGAEGSEIWSLPWGKVTLIDLYLGLLMFGGWIGYRDGLRPTTFIWWLSLVFLGNLAAGVYLLIAAFRASTTDELLRGRRSDAG